MTEWTTEDVLDRWETSGSTIAQLIVREIRSSLPERDSKVMEYAWDAGFRAASQDWYALASNPYRNIRLTPGGEVSYDEVPSNELPGMWERSDFV